MANIGSVMAAFHIIGVRDKTHFYATELEQLETLFELANGHLDGLPKQIDDLLERKLISDDNASALHEATKQARLLLDVAPEQITEENVEQLNLLLRNAHTLAGERMLPLLRDALTNDVDMGDVTLLTAEISDEIDQAEAHYAAHYVLAGHYAAKGFAYFLFGNLTLACREYSEAIRLDDEASFYNFVRAHIHALLVEMDEANADLEEAGRRDKLPKLADQLQSYRELYNRLIELYKTEPRPPLKGISADLIGLMAFLEDRQMLEQVIADDPTHLNGHLSTLLRDYGPTPLYFITSMRVAPYMKNALEMIEWLIWKGADPNKPAADGTTPLWNQTCENGTVAILSLLLEKGADPNAASYINGEASYPLANCLLPPSEKSLTEKFDDGTPAITIFPYDKALFRKATLLLEHGANPNQAIEGIEDLPPLRLAIEYGGDSPEALQLIEELLKRGASPNFVSSEGESLLQWVASENNQRVGELLLLYGGKMKPERDMPTFLRTFAADNFVPPPASASGIEACDAKLKRLKLPALPDDYVRFLYLANGFAFNSVELFGTDAVPFPETAFTLADIADESQSFRYSYVDVFGPADDEEHIRRNPLCVGRMDGDYLLYNPDTRKYQLRSHEMITDILGEYGTFEEMFWKEAGRYL
jgi:tetratricopeptide (TPR) repeat protein